MRSRLLLVPVIAALLASGYAAARTGADAIAAAEREASEAAARSDRLSKAAAEATTEAERHRARSEALIADIQSAEAAITAAEARIALIERSRAEQRARLAERQQPVIRLTAALQTMAMRPPALALVQPGSVEEMVRVRALLASTLPVIRARTAGLRAEVEAGDRLREQAEAAVAALAAGRDALAGRRTELARLEEAERQRARGLAASALLESDRSIALGEEARDLTGEMRSRQYQGRLRAELAALPGPVIRPSAGTGATANSAPPPYRLPVQGRLVTGMGEISDAGVHARGLTFDTAAGAPVIAPRSGTIAYAGRFRSYGEVVVIDHGGGWSSTVTGLAALRVRPGDRVEAGTPLGRSGGRLTAELRHDGRPHSITSFIAPAGR